MGASRTGRFGALSLGVWLGFGVGAGCGDAEIFNEHVLACEEAVAHVESCCGFEDTRVSCAYVAPVPDCSDTSGCNVPYSDSPCSDYGGPYTPGDSPDVSESQSLCLRRLSCDELRERGACELARTQSTAWVECS